MVWRDLHMDTEPPPPGDTARAAVLIALYDDPDDTTRLVLIKRPDTMPTHAGHIAFPGGRPGPGDAGPLDTALREAHEEVGIAPSDVEVLGYLPPVDTVALRVLVVPVVGRLNRSPLLTPSPREVVKIYQPSLEDLSDESRWSAEDWQGHQVWFYDLDGDILWGATAMMTRRLLGLEKR